MSGRIELCLVSILVDSGVFRVGQVWLVYSPLALLDLAVKYLPELISSILEAHVAIPKSSLVWKDIGQRPV